MLVVKNKKRTSQQTTLMVSQSRSFTSNQETRKIYVKQCSGQKWSRQFMESRGNSPKWLVYVSNKATRLNHRSA